MLSHKKSIVLELLSYLLVGIVSIVLSVFLFQLLRGPDAFSQGKRNAMGGRDEVVPKPAAPPLVVSPSVAPAPPIDSAPPPPLDSGTEGVPGASAAAKGASAEAAAPPPLPVTEALTPTESSLPPTSPASNAAIPTGATGGPPANSNTLEAGRNSGQEQPAQYSNESPEERGYKKKSPSQSAVNGVANQNAQGRSVQEEIPPNIDIPLLVPYKFAFRRDIFVPYTEVSITGVATGPVSNLARFKLSEFKLIGVLWNVKEPKAMVVDPEKTVHLVGKNDRIGRHNGHIEVIREGEVVVVETREVKGEIVYSIQTMKITR